nr:restriction endonuclease subunit S [Moraxella osloensis]
MIAPKLRFSEFKDEWFETTLNNLSNKIGDGLHATPKYDENGEIPFINGNNLINGKIVINESTKLINSDEFKKYNQKFSNNSIFLSINGTIGNIAFYNSESILLGKSVCFIDLSESSNKNLIYYILQSPVLISKFEKELTGTTIKNLSLATVRNTKFLLPNLKEQTKIAEFLSAVDDKISQLSRQLELLNQYKKGVMQKIFSQEIRFKNDNGEDFEEWENSFIGNECKITTGNKDTQNKIDDGIYPFFVRSQTVERINSYSMDCEAILTSGDGVGVGKNYHYINGKFDFHQRVYCLYDFSERLNGKYLFIYFSQFFFDRVKRLSAKNSVDSVRMDMISKMEIKLPSTPEQEKIAEFLTAIDERIDHTTAQLIHTKQWKKGLLQQMFV